MTAVDANAFLRKEDGNGVSVREHACGLLLWGPNNTAEGQSRIADLLRHRADSYRLLLFDLKTVWLAPGKHGRYKAMRHLLLAMAKGCEPALFNALAGHARHEGCIELMEIATVAAMASILRRGIVPGRHRSVAEVFLYVLEELDLSRARLTAPCDEHGHTLLHCPMPKAILEWITRRLSTEDFSLRSTARCLPAECWLQHLGRPSPSFGAEPSIIEGFQLLLEKGASLDFSGSKNKPPPTVPVCCAWSPSLLRILLDHGADPSLVDKQGRTVFSAFLDLPADMIIELVDKGGDVNYPGGSAGHPIISALSRGIATVDKDEVRPGILVLIEAGWDVNSRDAQGRTALFYATKDEIELLVEHGADPCVHTDCNFNALFHFIGHFDMVPPACLMVPENISSVSKNIFGAKSSILGWAVAKKVSPAVVMALVDAGAHVDGPPGADCLAPIACLVGSKIPECVKVLISLGAHMPDEASFGRYIPPVLLEELRSLTEARFGAYTKSAIQ